MAVKHVEELFSAAVDDQLSAQQAATFDRHLETCETCATAYETFRHAVDSVRALPHAAMPLPVHLPSGAPQAERATAAAWLRWLRPRTLPFGAATGIAALAAAAIVVVGLTRGSAPATTTTTAPNHAGQAGGALATPAACPTAAQSAGSAFAYRVSAADPSRPGQELLLSASEQSAAAGSAVRIYAVLTVPSQAIGAPGADAAVAPVSVAPCLSVNGLSAASLSEPTGAAGPGVPLPESGQQNSSAQGSASVAGGETLTIPAGTAPGTVVRVVASVPANYPGSAQASLSVALAITVR